jgi:DNA-binding NarL/FixJ family response regulator
MKKIRIMLVDDHAILREGLRALLSLSENIEVVGDAGSGKDAIDMVGKLNPEIIIMDIAMPILDGVETTRRITKSFPGVKIIILSQHDNKEYIISAIKAGASGYILKKAVSADIVSGIEAVASEGYYFDPSVAKTVIVDYLKTLKGKSQEDEYDRLSEREKEVLKLIVDGISSNDIAQRLCISVKTVLGHRTNIMEKLNIHNRTELIKYAIRRGIIQAETF